MLSWNDFWHANSHPPGRPSMHVFSHPPAATLYGKHHLAWVFDAETATLLSAWRVVLDDRGMYIGVEALEPESAERLSLVYHSKSSVRLMCGSRDGSCELYPACAWKPGGLHDS